MSCEKILEASVCAAEAHAKQKRKITGEPYINHILRVAEHSAKAGLSDEAIIAALLHDSVEDTKMTYSDLSKRFDNRVTKLVKLLTQWWADDASAEIKASEKPKFFKGIMSDQEAMAIKLIDTADNLTDLAKCLPKSTEWALRYLYRSERDLIPVHRDCKNLYARRQFEQAIQKLRLKLVRIGERPLDLVRRAESVEISR